MKNISQRTLEYNVGLVRYENPKQKDVFDLTTVHSLLVDQNPKFIQLRQLIMDYNSKQVRREVKRPHLQRPFVERLYKMLCQLTRMTHSQNQLQFLHKIYSWAFNEKFENQNFNLPNQSTQKVRPATASTKTRPYSAYTKRPDSGMPAKTSIASKETIQIEKVSKKIMEQHPEIDFKSLKHGQKQFFLGHRTLHPEEQRPRVRLKQYQRKVFYDEPDQQDKFKQFVEEKKQFFPKPKLPQIPLVQQVALVEQPKEGEQKLLPIAGQQGVEGQELGPDGVPVGGEEQANIDDLVGGDQEQAPAEQEEPQEQDKLKPRVKVYGNSLKPIPKQNLEQYNRGFKKLHQEKSEVVRKVEEDKMMVEMMQVWAATKNRVKIEQRRRAESARMVTKNTGIPFEKYTQKHQDGYSNALVVDLTQQPAPQIKLNTRPVSAFQAESLKVQNEIIKDALTTGKLRSHIAQHTNQNQADNSQRLCTFAAKPKKKTFEEILRQAEQRVNKEALSEIQEVKEKLSYNKVAIAGNKIFKSLSHHEPELLEGEFVGQIIGQGMIKNPFFKVAKKKKKKKKK